MPPLLWGGSHPLFTLLGRASSVVPPQSTTVLEDPGWSFLSQRQGDSSVTAALLSGLLVPWPCCRFWLEAGEFGACLRAGQFCKQWDVLSMGRWKLTRLSALKRMINKD